MKITIAALAAAFFVGAVGAASAAHRPSHCNPPASAYSAFSPSPHQDAPYAPNWGFASGGDDNSRQTAADGPASGGN